MHYHKMHNHNMHYHNNKTKCTSFYRTLFRTFCLQAPPPAEDNTRQARANENGSLDSSIGRRTRLLSAAGPESLDRNVVSGNGSKEHSSQRDSEVKITATVGYEDEMSQAQVCIEEVYVEGLHMEVYEEAVYVWGVYVKGVYIAGHTHTHTHTHTPTHTRPLDGSEDAWGRTSVA
jgi:hypothetical protein